jgi:hypothetical protein
MRPGLFHQHRHFVGDESGIRGGGAEHGQAAAMASRRDEQVRPLKLDDDLLDPTGTEVRTRASGQALHTGRQGGQVLGVVALQALGRGHGQPVAREDHGLPEVLYPISKIIE